MWWSPRPLNLPRRDHFYYECSVRDLITPSETSTELEHTLTLQPSSPPSPITFSCLILPAVGALVHVCGYSIHVLATAYKDGHLVSCHCMVVCGLGNLSILLKISGEGANGFQWRGQKWQAPSNIKKPPRPQMKTCFSRKSVIEP